MRRGEIVREFLRDMGSVGLGVHHTGSDGKAVGAEYLRKLTKLEAVVTLPLSNVDDKGLDPGLKRRVLVWAVSTLCGVYLRQEGV